MIKIIKMINSCLPLAKETWDRTNLHDIGLYWFMHLSISQPPSMVDFISIFFSHLIFSSLSTTSFCTSSQMGPPRLTVSQGLARVEEVAEALQGLTRRIKGPPNASMCPTSPSASETLTFGRCLGWVKTNIWVKIRFAHKGGSSV